MTRSTCLAASLALAITAPGFAVSDWTGLGDGTSWSDPANWNPVGVPTAADDVTIPAGAGAVEVDGTFVVADLACHRDLWIPTGRSLDVSGTGILTAELELEGTLSGGDFTHTGPFVWRGGLLTGPGIYYADGGGLIDGTTHIRRTVESTGTVVWQSSGLNVLVSTPGSFVNRPTGVFEMDNDDVIWWGTVAPGPIVNEGTWRKTSGTGTNDIRVPFDNLGVLEIPTGGVALEDGGTHDGSFTGAGTVCFGGLHQVAPTGAIATGRLETSSGQTTIEGSIDVGATVTKFTGMFLVEATANVVSLGALELLSGTLELDANAIVPSCLLENPARLTGLGTLTVQQQIDWRGGSMTGQGTTVAQSGVLFAGSSVKDVDRLVTSQGDTRWEGTGWNLSISSNGTFHNEAGATFEAVDDGILWWSTVGAGTLRNDGVFIKTGGSGGRTEVRVDVWGSGSVDGSAGPIEFETSLEIADVRGDLHFTGGGHTIYGVVDADLLSVEFAQVFIDSAAAGTIDALELAGTCVMDSDDVDVDALTLGLFGILDGEGTLDVAQPIQWWGGTMRGDGTTIAHAGVDLLGPNVANLDRTLESMGDSTWETTGWNFSISSNGTFHNHPGMTFDIDGGGIMWWSTVDAGVFVNDGVVRSLDVLPDAVRVEFVNNGTLEANADFAFDVAPTNLVGNILTGGTWIARGGMRIFGADVHHLDAHVVLDGASAILLDEFGNDALDDLSSIDPLGSMTLSNGATITPAPTLDVFGMLRGSGVVAADIFNDGIVAPGGDGAAGELVVEGNYAQTCFGALYVELGGTAPVTEHDVLSVFGTATLDGHLAIPLLDGWSVTVGELYTILDAATVVNQFLSADCPAIYQVQYGAADVDLEVILTQPTGDINCDGLVDVIDILAVIAQWGPCTGVCAADVNGDGQVDTSDLLLVLGNWT